MPRVTESVLDASALLALLQDEPGADRVVMALPGTVIGSVNLSEVAAKLADRRMPAKLVRETLGSLNLNIQTFDESLAYAVGELRPATAEHGLSLGDRACLALAQQLRVPALTTDQSWRRLNIEGVTIEMIR